MTITEADQALWAADVLLACMQEAGEDVEGAFAAAEYILREPKSLADNNPFPVADDAYPRDRSRRFINKHRIAAAAKFTDSPALTELLATTPDDQHHKLHSAVQHLQLGGTLHHPKEPPGLAINMEGRIVDPEWAYYESRVAERNDWTERQRCRDECRETLDRVTRIVRERGPEFDSVTNQLSALGATDAELRAAERAKHEVATELRPPHRLEEIYEDIIEKIHRRLDNAYQYDPEPPVPEQPDHLRAALAISDNQQQPEESPDAPPLEMESDRLDRIGLIAEILVSLFGDQSVEVAKKLKADANRERNSAAMSINAAFHLDPNGIWHGPQPPGPGWYQIAPGPAGGLRWAPGPGAQMPGQSGGGPPSGQQPAPAQPPRGSGQGQHAAAHRTRAENATAAHASAMNALSGGGSLSPQEKTDLSRHLSVMTKPQLTSLYAALGGTAVITGSQRQPWVHAIKEILLGPNAEITRPSMARGPRRQDVDQTNQPLSPNQPPVQAASVRELLTNRPQSLEDLTRRRRGAERELAKLLQNNEVKDVYDPKSDKVLYKLRSEIDRMIPSGKKPKVTVKAGHGVSEDRHEIKDFFGQDVDDDTLGAIGNAVDGGSVDISIDESYGKHLRISFSGEGVTSERSIYRVGGKLVIHNNLFSIAKDSDHKGKGVEFFVNQVQALRDIGVDRIETHAAGHKDGYFNGYYTWPRMGYDGTIERDNFNALPADLRSRMGRSRSVSDLFDLPGGKEAWKEYGGDIYDAKFDLSDDSRSMKTLAFYLEERKNRGD